ncbi:MAG: D-3-phosphoglycerate dehydrogenase [uncultured Cytophagales bacterium]|uniref:D-3-phosphoglycerate dehydrogenase n=1 Tax=uncultured Cytophagales bacterium TaxID=158755 RepID=A0A6J4J3H8_9SPHI|nr:MAG: D-3-phosphoglycerate dehydrogenase [uncultured Cytophagales bacterium]
MRILVIDLMHESLLPLLAEKGLSADYRPGIKREEVYDAVGDYEGLVVRSKITVDEALLQRAPRLRFIARAGAGMDQIDVEACRKRNIALFNAPEGNRVAVAEHALGMLLCLFNKLHLADRQVRGGTWDREGNRGVELMGKTVGIIGYGNTGREFARRVQAFGCPVLAYDKYLRGYGDAFAQESTPEAIFEQADVLSLHVPLTPETLGWVDEAFLGRFRKDIYLVNTARGEIVPLPGLVTALGSGKVRGACLDVLENEKLATLNPAQKAAFEALAASDRVLLTPHVAGWTHESYRKINLVLVEKIARFAAGA